MKARLGTMRTAWRVLAVLKSGGYITSIHSTSFYTLFDAALAPVAYVRLATFHQIRPQLAATPIKRSPRALSSGYRYTLADTNG